MKLLTDFIPIILFFVVFKLKDIYWATGVAIAATLVQVLVLLLRKRKVETMQWVTLAMMIVLGGATILLHDEKFVKWKATGVNWGFAVAFLVTQWRGQPLIKRMMGKSVELPEGIWRRLNLAWAGFFLFSGATNLAVAYLCSTEVWVNFKVFGLMGMLIVFVIAQALWLSRHMKSVDETRS